jgi:hypothetical protein
LFLPVNIKLLSSDTKEESTGGSGLVMVTMVTMGGDLQPGSLADRLLTGLGQPQINP